MTEENQTPPKHAIPSGMLISVLKDAPKAMNIETKSVYGDALIEEFLKFGPDPTTSMLIEQSKYLYSGPKGK